MKAVADHFAHHRVHMWGCALAAFVVAVALVFAIPILALLGALMCGAMMIGMIWMMVSMSSKHGR